MQTAWNRARQAGVHFRRADDAHGLAAAEDLLGSLAWDRGDFETSARRHRSAAAVAAEAGDVATEVQSLNNLGTALFGLGDYFAAGEIHERGVERSREIGFRAAEARHLDNLGGTAWAIGDYELAIERYAAALAIRRRTTTCSLALDDADPENGCLQVVPRSHLEPQLRPHRPMLADEGDTGNREDSHVLTAELKDDDEVVLLPVKRGSVSVHNEKVVHGSGGNQSTRWRRTYIIAHRSKQTVAHERSIGFTHSHNDKIQWTTHLESLKN